MPRKSRSGRPAGRHARVRLAASSPLLAVSFVAALSVFAAAAGSASASDPQAASAPAVAPQVGNPAPDFALPYATADTVAVQGTPLSAAVKQGPVLLAFYPADFSPGCTKEVCTLRDSFQELAGLRVTVWGISGDNVFAHRAWARSEKLPFRLLSDTRHEVARSYGSFNPESGFNTRTVFLIGRDGRVAYENVAYSVKDDHDFQALKEALRKFH
jgi:peroxiredoxin